MQKQELSTLSLALRAGKLILGFDKVVEEIKNKNAKGVFYTEDLSEKKPQGTLLCSTAAWNAAISASGDDGRGVSFL